MYSALKHQGQPLYKLARQGITVEREARPVTIFENRLIGFEGDRVTLDIACSKGTYVRSIAEDLGEALGCGAHVTALRRTAVGPFSIEDAITPGQLETAREAGGFEAVDAFLLPLSAGVGHFPEVLLPEATAYYLGKGQAVQVPGAPREGWVRLMLKENPEPTFLGVGEVIDDGRIAPRRLVVGK
jgi:tRNA pseudouridine55 synthase